MSNNKCQSAYHLVDGTIPLNDVETKLNKLIGETNPQPSDLLSSDFISDIINSTEPLASILTDNDAFNPTDIHENWPTNLNLTLYHYTKDTAVPVGNRTAALDYFTTHGLNYGYKDLDQYVSNDLDQLISELTGTIELGLKHCAADLVGHIAGFVAYIICLLKNE